MMRHSTGACGVAIALALSACSGGGSNDAARRGSGEETAVAGAAAKDVDPCTFVTPEEVTAITTDAVTSSKRDGDTCYYESNPNEEIRIKVVASGGKQEMETVHRAAGVLSGMGGAVADKGGAGADAAEMLKKDDGAAPKLGDEAAWGMVDMLSVRKGDAFVEVTPILMHDPRNHSGYPLVPKAEKRKIAEAIAAKVLGKLP